LKLLTTIFFILTFGPTFGQMFSYPTIKSNGNSTADFVPAGWTTIDSAIGDLNSDNLDDLALILQHSDSVTLIKIEDDYSDTVRTQSRILVVAFRNVITKQYDLVEQSNTFILNHDNPIMDEPFQDISISSGVLKIDFRIWLSMGSWETSNNSYKFRYQDNDFKLIGADFNSANRGSGETEDRSYNFLTKKVKVTKGNFSTDKKHKPLLRSFNSAELKTFKTFKEPFTYEVEKDFYL
jgi:hypothetical protein